MNIKFIILIYIMKKWSWMKEIKTSLVRRILIKDYKLHMYV